MSIEHFEHVAGVVFAELYDQFPAKIRIDEAKFEELENRHCGSVTSPGWMAWTNTIHFLASEGIIRTGEPHVRNSTGIRYPDIWPDLVLTAKGLALLNAVPKILQPTEPAKPLGKRIGDAVKTNSAVVVSALVKEVVSAAVKIYVSAFTISDGGCFGLIEGMDLTH